MDEIPSKEPKPIINQDLKDTNTINYPTDARKKPSASQSKSVRFTTPGDAEKKQPTGNRIGSSKKITTPAEKEVQVEPTKLAKLK